MNKRALRVLEYHKIIDKLQQKAESSLGKDMVSKLEPSSEFEIVQSMQEETNEAMNILLKRGNPPLGGIRDISNELRRAKIGAVLSPRGLLNTADLLRVSRRLKSFIKNDKADKKSSYYIIENYIEELNEYKSIEDSIFNSIISEEEISDNASSTLRSIRRKIETKKQSVRSKLSSIINSTQNKKYLQESLVTMRNDRFVVPVKQEYRVQFPGLIHDQSSSGATLFIEPMAIVNMNNELNQLRLEEEEEIKRILSELSAMIAEVVDEISTNVKLLGKIDFIFAKGKLALDMDAIKPKLNNEGYVSIKKARHPLIDKKAVVPIDIYVGKEFTSLVITGPNTGGKTVTLKTMGLLTLMAQAGLHIPSASGSIINIFKEVFADIGDEQSIEQSLSTFSAHMTNIIDILNSVRDNSLVLFDELGAGTDPTEGAALAISILEYLNKNKIRTVATTHYSELKLYALSNDNVENAAVEFDVETLSPTYKLLIGIAGKSNAFEISKKLGLQEFIIKEAKKHISNESIQFEDILTDIEKDRTITEKNREESEALKKEVEILREELLDKKDKIEKIKRDAQRKAKVEARKILSQAKEDADNIIKGIKDLSVQIEKEKSKRLQESKEKLKIKIDKIDTELTDEVLNVPNYKPPKNLSVGDTVRIVNLNQVGTVISLPDENGNLTVQVGIMKVNVNISNLQITQDEENEQIQKSTRKFIAKKTSYAKTEIDLRGKTVEEAILDVDKYLDDAYISNLNLVTIIHGKGTGVLRQGVRQLLKKHKHVKSYRQGEFSEGGTGVTVVELK
ncbi:endonuclease MutS2 [Abyssisolibacter fermentans]|uniref:endonuclease MutS2 n=1 Tax=Abyssisolibacter fermentans TaxID=1766203 RepID=UPI0008365A21|nr:endonuclease MutS2 [Abyssisolibacter fermentans]